VEWDIVKSDIAYRCRIFSVRRDESRSQQSGESHDFHVIETRDWVNIIPVTKDEQVVMVRQFRHGIRALTLEVPAGIIDDADPSPAIAATRELREETGYAAGAVVALGAVHPNPAIMNNRCHMFAAFDAEKVGEQALDATEELSVETVPLIEIPALIRSGAISNALTIVAFQLLGLVER